MRRLRIGDRWVGDGEPCYIVAEAGSNHNGQLEQAFRLIDVAAEAGADAVKFQCFKADRMYPKRAGPSGYLKINRSIHDIIRDIQMPDEWIPQLVAHCRQRRIEFICTPFDPGAADLLDPHVSVFKIASYEMTHEPLLRHVARKGKPVILSTGAATLAEVEAAVAALREEGSDEIILLQCTASYPTPLEAVNARALVTLREATGLLTGLSDHSRDPLVAAMTAVALGACLIEKHFTLSNHLPGPDHPFGVEPHELAELIRRARQVELVLGEGRKEALPVEEELRRFARRSIFAVREIAAGEELTTENIAVLRCGNLGFGLEPSEFSRVLGRRAARPIGKESLVSAGDLN